MISPTARRTWHAADLRRLGAWTSDHAVLASAAVLLVTTLLLRAVAFGEPQVDVDEQFYLLVGDRMLGGMIPYVDIWDRKPVGLFLIYAAARALGSPGIIQYQIFAAVSALATAWTVRMTSIRLGANAVGACMAGVAYLLWLDLLGGVGGQAPVFFNLPMALAGWLFVRELDGTGASSKRLIRAGLASMLLVGTAIQIKYTVMFEGIGLGVAFLALAWVRKTSLVTIALFAAGMVMLALLPSAAAAGYYWWIGHLPEFIFANFMSIDARLPLPNHEVLRRAISLGVVMLPLLSFAVLGPRFGTKAGHASHVRARRFILLWLLVAIGSVVGFGYFFDHYGLPIVVPSAIAAAPFFSNWPKTRAYIAALFAAAFIGGQWLALDEIVESGGWSNVHAIERATANVRNCPFVYDGPSVVILLRHWCTPTVYPFPYHLGYYPESRALGINVLGELERIMKTHPDAVLIRSSPYPNENRAARALVLHFLRADYAPEVALPFHGSELMVFRLKPAISPQPNDVMSRVH